MAVANDLTKLGASIVVMVGVAIASVMGILTLNGFKNTSLSTTQTNSSIDQFIAGIVIVGAFMEIIMLVVVAMIIKRLSTDSVN